MEKLTLDLGALAVESFRTAAEPGAPRGTVAARELLNTPLCVTTPCPTQPVGGCDTHSTLPNC